MTLQQENLQKAFAAPSKIVVATDLTDSEYLLPHAIAQARSSGASLILVHAVLPHESAPVESGAIPYYDPLRLDRDARLMLENIAREVRREGIECVTAVRHGFVPEVVTEVVENAGAGRLIVGTHGRRGLKKFVLGSVARQLLELVEIPVCTVGPRAHHGFPNTPGRILHPVSLAGMHETSAALSLDLARGYRAKLKLLHVIVPGAAMSRDPGQAVAAATEQVEALIPADAREFTEVQVRIALGTVVSEILAVAEEMHAGLMVLGVHAPAHSWLPGTEPAAYKILVSAPCPVLSLRANAAEASDQAEQKHEANPLAIG